MSIHKAVVAEQKAPSPKAETGVHDYIRMARFDHVTKHVFILPGILFALLLRQDAILVNVTSLFYAISIGLGSAVLVASANYMINEWLDREFDRFHPEKRQRAAVQRETSTAIVMGCYLAFLAGGLGLAWMVNPAFFVTSVAFAISGIIYNVQPFRSKDRTYVDVLTEAINNPIRLTLGWVMVDPTSLPPASILLAFWMGGAFLMNSKRLSEYRDIVRSDGKEVLGSYRRSFKYYTEHSLTVATMVYSLSCMFFMAVFLIKYRIEYVLMVPCLVGLFAIYYSLSMKPDSVARKPENLYRSRPLMICSAVSVVAFLGLTVLDLPMLDLLASQHFIALPIPE